MIIPTFLKWVGGKRRLIEQIDFYISKKFPSGKMKRYFEPFLGGGLMFFYIKQKYNPKFCMISDINKDLIETFKAVRDNPRELIKKLKYFKRQNSKEFYYKVRNKFNIKKFKGIRKSAAFIYLNKTCFNGLYRVNSKGEFNVPCGRYKNPEIFNEETIMFASKLLRGVKIICQDYRKIINSVKKEDFVYLDPCYDPINKTSFANYTPKRFCELDRIELSKFMKILKNNNVNVILSNNDLKVIRKTYSALNFRIKVIRASRSINSNPFGRGKINELLIIN